MPSNHIVKLRIAGLRGISRPIEMTLSKPLTLIYGENGTGKTSICDAVDFLGNGSVGSLEDISAGGQKHKYWPFLGSNPADISVYLEFQDGSNWEATTVGHVVEVTNKETRPIVKVWRRRQLIDLVLATPSSRYSVIEPFIDVSEIDSSEAALRDLKKQLDKDINECTTRLTENAAQIEGIAGELLEQGVSPIDWAKQQLSIADEDVDEEIKLLGGIINALEVLIKSAKAVATQIESNTQYAQVENDAAENYKLIKDTVSEGTEETLDVLTAAQHYFGDHPDPDKCPVCASSENVHGLKDSIDHQLATLTGFQIAKTNLTTSETQREDGDENLEQLNDVAKIALASFKESLHLIEGYLDSYKSVSSLSNVQNASGLNLDLAETTVVSLSGRKTSLSESKGARAALETAVESYDQNLESSKTSSAVLPVVKRCLEIHEINRKEYIDGVLASIADEVGRLYEFIHPGEGLNQISLQLDPKKRASLEIKSEFLNQQVLPGAYFSNSHLDSLGLCILIAIAKLEGAGNTILVMDDILGSIDEPHVDRLIELLYQESQHFLHMLVSTHYQAWHFKIRRGQLRNEGCQLLELAPWSATSGANIRDEGRSLLLILEENIANNPNEPEPIASDAGHLLEQLGDFLISRYECSVPKRVNGNTLNDYLDALKTKFIQHLVVYVKQEDDSYIDVPLEPMIKELKEIYQVRNTTGAHYNNMAVHMPVGDIIRFGTLVVKLGNALICKDNGLPNQKRNGAYWSTAGETRQLHPLAKP